MFLGKFSVVAARGRSSGGIETYSGRGRPTIGGHYVRGLLELGRNLSVGAMSTSRVRYAAVRAAALGAALACAVMRAVAQTAQGSTTAAATAKLVGTVTDTAGVPLSRAEIWLVAVTSLRTISNDSGHFELPGLPAGSVVLGVRRLGFEEATFTAVLKPGKTHRATFPLTPSVQPLAEVRVRDTISNWLAVFEQRRFMHRGTFLTRKDFANDNLRIASDILRRVPGVQIVPTRTGTAVTMTRGAGARRCIPQLYVHETPYSGNFDDFTPDDIEALEVYLGISEIPPDLNTMGRPICAAIVIWTREPPPKKISP